MTSPTDRAEARFDLFEDGDLIWTGTLESFMDGNDPDNEGAAYLVLAMDRGCEEASIGGGASPRVTMRPATPPAEPQERTP